MQIHHIAVVIMGHGRTLDSSEVATTTSDRSNLHRKALESTTSVLFVGGEHASKAGCRGVAGTRISVSLSYALLVVSFSLCSLSLHFAFEKGKIKWKKKDRKKARTGAFY
ncbi:hypothetical protein HanPSC8_Chr13g0589131 [Helianthus annuus]|nr:hypothetical protein HanPSC8_Chr13g0589131 [Helianthus annuus]